MNSIAKTILPQTAHRNAMSEMTDRRIKRNVLCSTSNMIRQRLKAIDRGSRQYPRTQTL